MVAAEGVLRGQAKVLVDWLVWWWVKILHLAHSDGPVSRMQAYSFGLHTWYTAWISTPVGTQSSGCCTPRISAGGPVSVLLWALPHLCPTYVPRTYFVPFRCFSGAELIYWALPQRFVSIYILMPVRRASSSSGRSGTTDMYHAVAGLEERGQTTTQPAECAAATLRLPSNLTEAPWRDFQCRTAMSCYHDSCWQPHPSKSHSTCHLGPTLVELQ
ncbi:hypothetical protein BDZ85DRAFT_250479 [Elsinoe ampelina]|uniref:Uncharacterized protein n=1 Tax=Elsinoe ampelina TaxID=302913 RepID=A0A6A6GA43_9PEZI|nr:hypothetical protein BDZ85DRAFT_250479 [Elsinoe ampelina]